MASKGIGLGGQTRLLLSARNRWKMSRVIALAVSLTVVLFLLSTYSSTGPIIKSNSTRHMHDAKPWGTSSPYIPSALYKPPPESCQITQVNILQRHGSRYPKEGFERHTHSVLKKLQAVANYTEPSLAFLNDYRYNLEEMVLAPLGAEELYEAGWSTYERYQHLVRKDNIPFVRCGSTNNIASANNWSAGFAAASQQMYSPPITLVFSEEMGINSSIHISLPCPSAGNSKSQTTLWASIFAPSIRDRISSSTLLSAEQMSAIQALSNQDIKRLMMLCPYEHVALRKSPFCELFADDFASLDYWDDLYRYYTTGYGQPLGPVQGVGYINELIARLTASPVRDNTQTNRTLDSDPLTFPLDRTIYLDHTHSSQMIAIYSAMGLFKPQKHLDPTKMEQDSVWKMSKIMPFGGRMVVEKLSCQGEDKVRVLVNDEIMPQEICGGVEGICSLKDFIQSQSYAMNNGEGDFERCSEHGAE